jgi:hypothetical protein
VPISILPFDQPTRLFQKRSLQRIDSRPETSGISEHAPQVGSPRRTGPALEKKSAHRPMQPVSGPVPLSSFKWSWRRDLNPRPSDYKSDALPAELRQPFPPGKYPENQFQRPKSIPKTRTDTLPLRTFNGTEIKVSTPRRAEQTGPAQHENWPLSTAKTQRAASAQSRFASKSVASRLNSFPYLHLCIQFKR